MDSLLDYTNPYNYIQHANESPLPQGWLYPHCGKVNAPWRSQCDCGPHTNSGTSEFWTCQWCGDRYGYGVTWHYCSGMNP